MDYWQIQDIYLERTKLDYESGAMANPVYKPYFRWKFYGAPVESLTKQMCYEIMKEAQKELEALDSKYPKAHNQVLVKSTQDDVWKPYKGYGSDCFLYSYLIGIEAEITNILIMKRG